MKRKILFVCIHNSARSQMAEALLNRRCGDFFDAESAGLEPGELNAVAVEVLREIGLDISGKRTRSVVELLRAGSKFDHVITVCDEGHAAGCPVFPGGGEKLHWGFPDPSIFTGSLEERLAATREVRDLIRDRVETWCARQCVSAWGLAAMAETIRATRPEPPPHVSAEIQVARTPIPKWAVGEFFGTFLLVFFGCGSVCAAVLTGAQVGVFQVAIVWGLGIATAIYLTGSLSSAHLNPAVTIASAVWARFPKRLVLPYIAAQMIGAFVAAAALFGIFAGPLRSYEDKHGIIRGEAGSEATAMVFGEYFPNPGGKALTAESRAMFSSGAAFAAEVVGTAILLLVIFCATDEQNVTRPQLLTAATIGLTVTLLISLFGPLTMACFNPARDLAPRVFSSLAGWGSIPFRTNGTGWLTIYIIAPLLGGLLGGAIYRVFFRGAYRV